MPDFERYRSLLRRFFAHRIFPFQEVEDLVQETLLRAHVAIRREGLRSPRAFLFSTARHLVVDHHRRLAARGEVLAPGESLDALAGAATTPEEDLERAQRSALLRRAILHLPPRCRTALILRRFHHLSYRQIAERMGITEKTVEKHLARALVLCREYVRGAEAGRVEELPVQENDRRTRTVGSGDSSLREGGGG